MNRYNPGTPRKALALAALAITTLTFALLVIVPAEMGSDEQGSPTVIAMHDLARWMARSSRLTVPEGVPARPAMHPLETAAKG
ncbi:MAG TPA: hypothetical protein VJ376_05740 [Pseudomonadota bacterium]|nr:hypothetical protein [Pseudomonadota bacterium]